MVAYIIIPYQEQLGNYNLKPCIAPICDIIPYQEQLGNYNLIAVCCLLF